MPKRYKVKIETLERPMFQSSNVQGSGIGASYRVAAMRAAENFILEYNKIGRGPFAVKVVIKAEKL